MIPNPKILKSIEKLDYRVTVGDVAAQAGLELNFAQEGLLALASEAGGHLQVADSGDVVYLFPKNFRSILRNKYWQLRWQQTWAKIWKVLFYIIRISFGIVLIASIALMMVAIIAIVIAMNSSNDEREGGRGRSYGGGGFFMPRFWIGDIFWWFDPGYNRRRLQRRRETSGNYQMNFLESVFSFLFGDGDPNADLEENRYSAIGSVIRAHKGAVVGEQIAPYVDKADEDEDYMIPVLSRFNGYPEVSPQGQIVYYFPELQVMASQRGTQSISSMGYLQEKPWLFSQANGNQITMAAGLGVLNIIVAFVLQSLLQNGAIAEIMSGQSGESLVMFTASIFWLLLSYGILYLSIPLVRYFWIKGRNPKIANRNEAREQRAIALKKPSQSLQQKISYASQFARQKIIGQKDITYTTEDDLLDQNLRDRDKIDREWQQRLESDS
ncbi:hypothetical protein I4641_03780 [Waterburya agarophytonicola K14]|uniref:Iron-sulfur cluster biosynthesis family protein n=1 Tax=Waterburya agarophytonicola KI4 TaxID=2874699 RepID=A0A964FG19_9CYAN|nr:hypothetical protein [Waterburya agarophytonicola]MCC0176099.1 hypothetical protein [Waterburya agarophytonicola KI4]